MGSPELAQYADFYADHNARFALTENLSLRRDISERLHQLTSEPEGVTYRDVTANGVPAILVMPVDSSTEHILLHSHFGGSVTASMWQERKAVGHLAKAAGSRALAINYRLAPENKFPAQIDDVETAYRWLLDQGYDPTRIASTGDSIGGNYAVNLALTLQRKGAPLPGVVLSMSPWFDMELKNASIDANASLDKMLSRDGLRAFSNFMLDGTGVAVTDPRINLAYADPAGLPPTMIFYGEYELLVDDANQFAERARAAGVDLELRSLPEGQHNFFLGAGRVPETDAAVSEMGAWLRSKMGLAVAPARTPTCVQNAARHLGRPERRQV
jgi:epsilon-lactone hydrolase